MNTASSMQKLERNTLLFVGDPLEGADLIEAATRAGWRTVSCADVGQASSILKQATALNISAVVLDLDRRFSVTPNAAAHLTRSSADLPLIVVASGRCSERTAENAQNGASGPLSKPISRDRFIEALQGTMSGDRRGLNIVEPVARPFEDAYEFSSLVGRDRAFRASIAQAAISARGSQNILIEGESGTGKRTVACAIHGASPRRGMPGKSIDVEQASPTSLMSLLFGHEQGAFVGAFQSQQGLMQQCDGGTLIVDGIDRMPLELQEEMAEAIGKGRVQPIGANLNHCVNVRVIALSEQPLSDLVAQKLFSIALYQSLSATRIVIPPLRDRPEDIALIAEDFLSSLAGPFGRDSISLHKDALSVLSCCDWQGNVRQLQAHLAQAAAYSRTNVITPRDLRQSGAFFLEPDQVKGSHARPGRRMAPFDDDGHLRTLRDIEDDIIRMAVDRYDGCMTEIAKRLGIGRSTLYRKVSEPRSQDRAPSEARPDSSV